MLRDSNDDGCPGEDDIVAFLGGCLKSQDARALEAHVARCSACRRLLSALALVAAGASRPATDSASPTLPLDSSEAVTETELQIGAQFGRYFVLDWLGAGGMGVVYAAYDPELNRKVALKVLRNDGASPAARGPIHDLLLREAQAMAQLAHPNVVAVYDVGSVEARVFFAMELVEGTTLARWTAAARRDVSELIDVFLAAGRGLAAAHDAGLIHRDFKPDNVLIGNDGRARVTDFGLARQTLRPPLDAEHGGAAEPRPEAGTMQTGLAGTLAYMAPEQYLGRSADARVDQFSFAVALHEASYRERPRDRQRSAPEQRRGNDVTPATDQFAYCVALWEALAGERPYHAHGFDELRRQIATGPAALDASRIPRRVRSLLRRGLEPDPARRWPSMNALLDRLARTQRSRVAVIIASAVRATVAALVVVVAIASVAYSLRSGEVAAISCDPPVRDVTTVWSPAIASEVRVRISDAHVAVLDTAYWDWRAARGAACKEPPARRHTQLRCLEGLLARFDALRRAFVRAPEATPEELRAQLSSPSLCRNAITEKIPKFTLVPTASVIDAYALYARSQTEHKPSDAEIQSLVAAPDGDICGRAIGILAFESASRDVPRKRALVEEALTAAYRCADDRLRTDVLIAMIPYRREHPMTGPRGQAAIEEALAAGWAMRADVEGALAMQTLTVAREHGRWDEALQHADMAVANGQSRILPVRMLRAIVERNRIRLSRSEPGDLDAVIADVRAWRQFAARHQLELARQLEVEAALAQLRRGDVAAAHLELVRLWQSQPRPAQPSPSHHITGIVVDARGNPAVHARVAASRFVTADAVDFALPDLAFDHQLRDDDLRITTTDAAGRFAIEDAVADGVIVAELASQRSPPAAITDHLTLVLGPTRNVSGRVELAGIASTRVVVVGLAITDPTGRFEVVASVAPDGSFTVAGAPIGTLRIGAALCCDELQGSRMQFVRVPASSASATGIVLSVAPSGRALDVVVRSAVTTALEGAQVVLLQGAHVIANFRDIVRLPVTSLQSRIAVSEAGEPARRALRDVLRVGDLVAHFDDAGPGDWTVCASSLAPDRLDPESRRRVQDHLAQIAVKCVHVGPDAASVVIDAPPQRRLN